MGRSLMKDLQRSRITKIGFGERSNKNVNGTELLVDKVWIKVFCYDVDEPSIFTMKVNLLVDEQLSATQ
jgi:hypothetical protein